MSPLAIPKTLVKNDDLVVLEKKHFDSITQENHELKLAIQAILNGESALRRGRTRTFRDFLKSRPRKHGKDY